MSRRRRSSISRPAGPRRAFAALAALALVLLVATACGGNGEGAAATKPKSEATGVIGLSLNGSVEYTKNLSAGVAKTMDGSGYALKTVQADFNVNTELSNVESLLGQGVKGLVINPNTTEGVLTGVKAAHKAGIPVGLAFWTGPTSLDDYLTTVAFIDSESIGRELGEYLKEHATPGPTVVVQGVLGQGFSEGIDKGLNAALTGSGFDIVTREQGFFDRSKAISVVEAALQAHPEATAIVDYSSAMGDGISSFLKNNGHTKISHLTVSVDDEMLQWLGTPYLAATSYYSPAEAGELAMQGVLDELDGKDPAFRQEIFHQVATANDIDRLVKDHPYKYDGYADSIDVQ